MFRDQPLLPRETMRLTALGLLSEKPLTYPDLAVSVRQIVGRFAGPSTEQSVPSIELFRYEGLVAPADDGEEPLLRLTEAGQRDFSDLLTATVRPPLTDLSMLVIALKVRFLWVLEAAQCRRQIDGIIKAYESELSRLSDDDAPAIIDAKSTDFASWLGHEVDLMTRRIQWLKEFRNRF